MRKLLDRLMAMLGYLPEGKVLTHHEETGKFSDKNMTRDENLVAVGRSLPMLYDLLERAYTPSDRSMSEFITRRRLTLPAIDYDEYDDTITVLVTANIEACFDVVSVRACDGRPDNMKNMVTVRRTDTDASITFSLGSGKMAAAIEEDTVNQLDKLLRPDNI